MIKEWCEKCDGRKGIYVQDDKYPTLAKLINCHNCQGKGYTELEPESIFESGAIKTNATITLNGGYRKFEVYIKELKNE